MLIEATARKFLAKIANGVMAALRLTGNESLVIAQVEPSKAEMSRAGRRFALGNQGATGVIPVTAVPTTAAQWVIYNQIGSNRTLFIEELGLFLSAGTPANGGVTLFAALIKLPAPTTSANFANMTIASQSGGALSSQAVLKSAVSVSDPALPAWRPVAEMMAVNVAAFPGAQGPVNRDIDGGIAVPPGYGLALAAVGPTGTAAAYLPTAQWVEYEADME